MGERAPEVELLAPALGRRSVAEVVALEAARGRPFSEARLETLAQPTTETLAPPVQRPGQPGRAPRRVRGRAARVAVEREPQARAQHGPDVQTLPLPAAHRVLALERRELLRQLLAPHGPRSGAGPGAEQQVPGQHLILGEVEANIEENKINVASPLARALIGKEVGDEVRIPGKGGPRMVEISDVTFDG